MEEPKIITWITDSGQRWGFEHDGAKYTYHSELEANIASQKLREDTKKSKIKCKFPPGSTIFIDFDGTIYLGPFKRMLASEMSLPAHNAKETIQALKEAGMKVFIYSCRSSRDILDNDTEYWTEQMIDYLKIHEIPFDGVKREKPHYACIIDDRAVAFNGSWNQVQIDLDMRVTK